MTRWYCNLSYTQIYGLKVFINKFLHFFYFLLREWM